MHPSIIYPSIHPPTNPSINWLIHLLILSSTTHPRTYDFIHWFGFITSLIDPWNSDEWTIYHWFIGWHIFSCMHSSFSELSFIP
jgi:hypothetical protein